MAVIVGEKLNRLKQMWADGVPVNEIADRLCCTSRTVENTRRREGLISRVPPSWSEAKDDALRKKWRTMSTRDIANLLGVTKNAVIGRARRLGLASAKTAVPRPKQIKGNKPAFKTRVAFAERPVPKEGPIEPLPEPQVDDVGRVAFADLKAGMCRFVVGEPSASAKCFCGEATPEGASFCAGHARRVYQQGGKTNIPLNHLGLIKLSVAALKTAEEFVA